MWGRRASGYFHKSEESDRPPHLCAESLPRLLEDVDHLSRSDRESWTRRFSKIGSEMEESIDPFNLEAAGDTPALRLWARPGREYIRMLNELTECDFDPHFTHRSSEATSLLGNLQEDILNRAPRAATGRFRCSRRSRRDPVSRLPRDCARGGDRSERNLVAARA